MQSEQTPDAPDASPGLPGLGRTFEGCRTDPGLSGVPRCVRYVPGLSGELIMSSDDPGPPDTARFNVAL